jgi:outer membrane protein
MFSAQALAEEMNIVYADLQRALNESDAGIAAKEELKQEAEKREGELNAQQEELKKLKEEIDKKGSVWNEETRKQKEDEFNTQGQEFQKQYMQYGEELNKKKLEREGEIIDELREIVNELAEKNGYTYVLEVSMGGILYGPSGADITDELIKTYNEKSKEKEG